MIRKVYCTTIVSAYRKSLVLLTNSKLDRSSATLHTRLRAHSAPADAGASLPQPDVAINVSVGEQRGDKSHALGSLPDGAIRFETTSSVVNYV